MCGVRVGCGPSLFIHDDILLNRETLHTVKTLSKITSYVCVRCQCHAQRLRLVAACSSADSSTGTCLRVACHAATTSWKWWKRRVKRVKRVKSGSVGRSEMTEITMI